MLVQILVASRLDVCIHNVSRHSRILGMLCLNLNAYSAVPPVVCILPPFVRTFLCLSVDVLCPVMLSVSR